MNSLDKLNQLTRQLFIPSKTPGQKGTIGYHEEFLPEYATNPGNKSKTLRGYWRRTPSKNV